VNTYYHKTYHKTPKYYKIWYRKVSKLYNTKAAGKHKLRICETLKFETIYRVFRGNVPDFGRMFLKLKYTDITNAIYIYIYIYTHTHIYTYRVSRGECARLRENVPYVKIHRYNKNTYIRS